MRCYFAGGVPVPSRLLAGPEDQLVSVDKSVVLECAITGLPYKPVTWTRQGMEERHNNC